MSSAKKFLSVFLLVQFAASSALWADDSVGTQIDLDPPFSKIVDQYVQQSIDAATACDADRMGCTPEQLELREQVLGEDDSPDQPPDQSIAQPLAQPLAMKPFVVPNPFGTGDAILFGATVAAGGLAFANDQKIMNAVQANKPAFTNTLAVIGNDSGEYGWIPVAVGFLGSGYLAGDSKAEQTGYMILAASAATGALADGGKYLFGRERPNAGDGPYDFGTKGQSTPSGHVTEAATVATVIAEQYGDHDWVAPLAYATVALTAYARMHDQKHWMSDTIAGFALGHFGAKYVMKMFKKDGTSYPGLLFTPVIDPISHQYQLDVSYLPGARDDDSGPMKCSGIKGDTQTKVSACVSEAFQDSDSSK